MKGGRKNNVEDNQGLRFIILGMQSSGEEKQTGEKTQK